MYKEDDQVEWTGDDQVEWLIRTQKRRDAEWFEDPPPDLGEDLLEGANDLML